MDWGLLHLILSNEDFELQQFLMLCDQDFNRPTLAIFRQFNLKLNNLSQLLTAAKSKDQQQYIEPLIESDQSVTFLQANYSRQFPYSFNPHMYTPQPDPRHSQHTIQANYVLPGPPTSYSPRKFQQNEPTVIEIDSSNNSSLTHSNTASKLKSKQDSKEEEEQRPANCIFIGNIPYDSSDQEIAQTLQLAGPFKQFRLKIEKQTQQPKGYGFCEFTDKDVAASALRNLAKYDLNKRELKVDYASDNKNGTNLRPEDVTYRDIGDLNLVFAAMMTLSSNLKNVPMTANNLQSVAAIVNQHNSILNQNNGDPDNLLFPLHSTSSTAVEECLQAMPLKHQIMLIYSLKGLYEHLLRTQQTDEINNLVQQLATSSSDGLTHIKSNGITGIKRPESMLSVMQAMLANVRKAVQSPQSLQQELANYF